MNASGRAAQLRAEADALESLADLEAEAVAAKAAYREDPSEKSRAAHRAASAALNDARSTTRPDVVVVSAERG